MQLPVANKDRAHGSGSSCVIYRAHTPPLKSRSGTKIEIWVRNEETQRYRKETQRDWQWFMSLFVKIMHQNKQQRH